MASGFFGNVLFSMDALECEVGIRNTLSPPSCLQGELKSRYSDFLVNEISAEGSVVHLTRLWPHQVGGAANGGGGAGGVGEEGGAPGAPKLDPFLILESIIGSAAAASVRSMVELPAGCEPLRVPLPEDKAARRSLHESVRALSGGRLDSDTLTLEDGQRCIRISRPTGQGVKRARPEASSEGAGGGGGGGGAGGTGWRRNGWDASRPPYVRFVLHKVNMDSASALRSLARALGCKEKAFGVAGTKDKRAATVQHVTLYRMEPERIARAVRSVRGLAVGDFEFVRDALHLGELWGNRFTVIVRRLRLRQLLPEGAAAGGAGAGGGGNSQASLGTALEAVMGQWKARGYRFVSYFGLQRFGGTASLGFGGAAAPTDGAGSSSSSSRSSSSSAALRTHLVGRCILAGDWEGALRLLLSPRAGSGGEEGADSAAATANTALAALQAGTCTLAQALAAISSLPHYFTQFAMEKKLLGEAVKRCNASEPTLGGLGRPASLEVVLTIPPHSRALYVHAYQSYLWNELASARCGGGVAGGGFAWSEGSSGAVEGDLVLLNPAAEPGVAASSAATEQQQQQQQQQREEEGGGRRGRRAALVQTLGFPTPPESTALQPQRLQRGASLWMTLSSP